MQRISQQRFYVDDKELPFIAKPTKSDVGYWTLGKEASAGWDTNVLVFKPANGARSISIRAIYEGANGIATYLPETRTSRSLSDQDRTEFLRLEDEGYTHTSKPELDRVLKKNGLLRGAGEPDVDYALRFARWMKNIKYELNGGGQDDIANSIENKVSGNCNQFAGLETFALRSQGIPARMPSGYAGDNRDQHVLCEFYCEKTGCWYRMPMSTNETDPRKVFGYDVEQTLVFQIDTTFWPEYSLPVMVEGTGSSNGCGEWMVYEGGEFQFAMQANYDKARSWSKAFSR